MQEVIVTIIVCLTAAYASRRIWKRLTNPYDPCTDCPGCPLKGTKQKGKHCEERKNSIQQKKTLILQLEQEAQFHKKICNLQF